MAKEHFKKINVSTRQTSQVGFPHSFPHSLLLPALLMLAPNVDLHHYSLLYLIS